MSLSANEIRTLRQRLGWSCAELARQLGCKSEQVQAWESGAVTPDPDSLNQLQYLAQRADANCDQIQQKPLAEKEIEARRVEQLTHRDLIKDIQ